MRHGTRGGTARVPYRIVYRVRYGGNSSPQMARVPLAVTEPEQNPDSTLLNTSLRRQLLPGGDPHW